MQTVATLVRKKFMSEMDLLRLRKALLACRLSADSTALVDHERPGHSSKLERLYELLADLLREPGRKIVLFSEWTGMLDRIEEGLRRRRVRWVRLDGSVPQKERQALVNGFFRDPACRLFLATNAGSVGLNLQVANTLVNVDLPWNPAVLEQRIGRVHRMGQTDPVQVFVLVTEETIEEKLLSTLAAKADLALAVLDPDSDVETIDVESGIESLRSKLEVLFSARPAAPLDASEKPDRDREVERHAARDRVAQAGGRAARSRPLLPRRAAPWRRGVASRDLPLRPRAQATRGLRRGGRSRKARAHGTSARPLGSGPHRPRARPPARRARLRPSSNRGNTRLGVARCAHGRLAAVRSYALAVSRRTPVRRSICRSDQPSWPSVSTCSSLQPRQCSSGG
jgi:superfamily II DNA/RNA helicase